MINVLLPSMGNSTFFKDSFFPKPLYEIDGKTMIELVVEDYTDLEDCVFTFVFSEEDCLKFHLDDSARLLAPGSNIIRLTNQTAGALCTCLMAVEYINNEYPLIIANSDQIIKTNYHRVLDIFEQDNFDAGVITFPSIHPRWSYARKKGNAVVEVAEKRPLSRDAIAGFYYYRCGSYFIEAAKAAILKQNSLEGQYYISASMNEIILSGKRVGYFDVRKEDYKSFYSPAKIQEYEGAKNEN